MVFVIVKCEYISHSPHIEKEQNAKHFLTKREKGRNMLSRLLSMFRKIK